MSKRKREDDEDEVFVPLKRRNVNNRVNICNNWESFGKGLRTKNDVWVSATDVSNYLLREPLLDWFKVFDSKKSSSKSFTCKLFENGNKFEEMVVADICEKFPEEYVFIESNRGDRCSQESFEETISSMKRGVPFIFQGVLKDNKTHLQGISDVIIRSDYINKLVDREEITENDAKKPCNFSREYHYRIIDIKWSSLSLCANKVNIRNEGRFRAYKGQLAIYNYLLGVTQGYFPYEAYILGKSWKIESTKEWGFNCFDLLGTINYQCFDENVIGDTYNAILWRRKLFREGKNWDPFHPNIPEMYPNASNTYDAPWTEKKKKIIEEIKEITSLYQVSVDNRNKALLQGVKSWEDHRCNSKILGINNKHSIIIDKILEINQSSSDLVLPHVIINNFKDWKHATPLDFYVDFEMSNETTFYYNGRIETIIALIGIGWVENNKWKYVYFLANTLKEERNNLKNFLKFVSKLREKLDPKRMYEPRFIHFSHAEPVAWEKACCHHLLDSDLKWLDMREVLIQEPVVFKGALKYSLEEIATAMYKNNCIKTIWKKNGPTNGADAMFSLQEYYETNNKEVLQKVIQYNHIDCKVMWEILTYLRKKHI